MTNLQQASPAGVYTNSPQSISILLDLSAQAI
jgi:hypothetical protein